MEATSNTGLPDLESIGVQNLFSFNLSEAKLEDDFMGSAVLQRHRGGHNVAMPSWTIVPMLYHAPPHYNFKERMGRREDPDDKSQTGKYIQEDYLGASWAILWRDRQKHNSDMQLTQKYALEGLSDMKSVRYFEAVAKFDTALSTLWGCHMNTPMERWIKTHRGHALLRAALLQSPDIHGKKTSDLLQMSFECFLECVIPLRGLGNESNRFNRSLLFSNLLGLAWIYFFRGNMEEAELYMNEAESLDVSPGHRRTYIIPKQRHALESRYGLPCGPPVDIDTLFIQGALHRVVGSLDDVKSCMSKFGCDLSYHDEDCCLVELLDIELLGMEGNFEQAVGSTSILVSGKPYMDTTLKDVADILDRLRAGYSGNVWFALGACQQAKAAYECALGSNSVLVRAAALVGLGNVFMRLIQGSSEVDGVQLGFAEAEKKYKEALEVYDELNYREGQIKVHSNLGNLYHKRGQLQVALVRYAMAKSYVTKMMDNGFPALHLHLKLAELYLDMKDWKMASNSIRTANNILIPSGKLSEAASQNYIARAWIEHLCGSYHLEKSIVTEAKEEHDLSTARGHLECAIKFFTKLQVNVGDHMTLWLTIFEQQKETYALHLWCIAYHSHIKTSAIEALVWCERSRSRALMVDCWHRYFIRLREYLTDDAVTVAALTATAAPNGTLLSYEESWRHLQVLLKRCKLPVATVVEYVTCADFGFLIIVLDIPEGEPKMFQVSFKEHGLDGEKLAELVNRTISLLNPKTVVNGKNDKREDEAEAHEKLAFLYKLLIKPVEGCLKNTHQIIVIPHEVLFKVPFHALLNEEHKFLIERYILSYEESMRTLVMHSLLWELNKHSLREQVLEHQCGQKPKKKWLVVGINKHKPFAPDLHAAESEALAVDRILGEVFEVESTQDKRLFRGSREGATKEQVMPHFAKADIIHLATHGIINAKFERGGILFQAPAGVPSCNLGPSPAAESFKITKRSVTSYVEVARRSHGSSSPPSIIQSELVLSASEISSLRLKAQLVVLSACQSANGVILGEGVAGLARALLQAGVSCTVLSLWRVLDDVTVTFMENFYKTFARDIPVADAMKVAMNTMINATKKYSEERRYTVGEWAPFLAFGLPTVRVQGLRITVLPESPELPDPSVLKSQSILHKLLGKFGILAALVSEGRTTMTRSKSMTEEIIPYAWNPLRIKGNASSERSSKGLPFVSEEKMVIFAFVTFLLHS